MKNGYFYIRKLLLHFNGNDSFNRKDVMDPIFKRKKRNDGKKDDILLFIKEVFSDQIWLLHQ